MRTGAESGIKVGEYVSAFHPHHISGPHKGTDACPPCTYGALPAVQVWVNGDDIANVEKVAKLLNDRVGDWNKSKFKAFFIFVTDGAKKADTTKMIETVVGKVNAKIPMAWIDKTDGAIKDYKVNTDGAVKNTIFVYKDKQVQTKFVNFEATKDGLAKLTTAIDSVNK